MKNFKMMNNLLDLDLTEEDAIEMYDILSELVPAEEEYLDSTFGYHFIHEDFLGEIFLDMLYSKEQLEIKEMLQITLAQDYAEMFSPSNEQKYIGNGWYSFKL